MGEYAHLRVESDGGVLTVTLDRPERLNAVNDTMADALTGLLVDAEADHDVRAIVLTGAGRGFCAGADVGDIASAVGSGAGPGAIRTTLRGGHTRLARAVLDAETPLVAAVNGPCAGAGIPLALACDVVVASAAASFSVAFIRRGLVPDYGTTFLLPRLVGLRAARELCLLGDRIDAAAAERLGLVTTVVAADELLATAQGYARRLADGPGLALGLTKRLLAGAFEGDALDAIDREFTAQALCLASADAAEGAAAFLEKRAPRFTGR